jgi:hypothetical protein
LKKSARHLYSTGPSERLPVDKYENVRIEAAGNLLWYLVSQPQPAQRYEKYKIKFEEKTVFF